MTLLRCSTAHSTFGAAVTQAEAEAASFNDPRNSARLVDECRSMIKDR